MWTTFRALEALYQGSYLDLCFYPVLRSENRLKRKEASLIMISKVLSSWGWGWSWTDQFIGVWLLFSLVLCEWFSCLWKILYIVFTCWFKFGMSFIRGALLCDLQACWMSCCSSARHWPEPVLRVVPVCWLYPFQRMELQGHGNFLWGMYLSDPSTLTCIILILAI